MRKNPAPSVRWTKLDSFNQDCLDLFTDMSVDSLLRRVLQIASSWTNACYCVAGLTGEKRGTFSKYHIYGLTPSEREFFRAEDGEQVYSIPSDETIVTKNLLDCQKYRVFQNNIPYVTSILHVPIFAEDKVIGSITAMNKIGAAVFSQEDVFLMEKLAVYAGLAVNNALLHHRSASREKMLTKRNEDLALLNDLGRVFADTDGSVSHMMDEMLDMIVRSLGMELGECFLNIEEDPNEFNLLCVNGHDYPGSLLGLDTVTLGEGLLGEIAAEGMPYFFNSRDLNIVNEKKILRSSLNYMVVIPLMTAGGTIGLLLLGARFMKGQDAPELTLLTSISGWIAPLIENLRLSNQRQKVAILEERERIGMDLHDGVIQSIYGVGLTLENARLTALQNPDLAAERIKLSIEALNAIIRDIRSYIMNLKPERLNHENIVQSMRRLANDYHANSFVPTEFIAKVEHVESLSDEAVGVFYMVCKEGLSNILKHAHPTRVDISFTELKDRFVLMIQDNGAGFDTSKAAPEGHHGVNNMHARARNLGGDLDISSIPGKGTTVIAWLPLSEKSAG